FAIAGAAGIAAGAAIGGVALRAFMSTGDELDKMRQRTGFSVEALSELRHAADQSGASIEDLETGIRKMQRELGKAGPLSKEMEDAISALGLSASQLQAMSPEQQFDAIAKAIGKVSDPTKRAGLAMQFFGKSGTKLLPMIEDMEALRAEAREMGFVMSGQGAANAVKLGDALDNLWKTVKFASIAIGESLAPAMLKFVETVQPVATATLKWMQSIRDAILGGKIELAGKIAFAGLRVAALQGVVSLSTAVGGAVGDFLGSIGSKFIGGDFQGAWNDAVAGMLETWSNFSQGIVEVFGVAANFILDQWQKIEDTITDFLLKNAAEGGIFGKLALAGTGIDFQKEVERGKRIAQRQRELGLATGPDSLTEAQNTARSITAGRADAAREKLNAAIEAMRAAAQQSAEEARRNREQQTGGGANRAQEALAQAQAELDALRAQVKQQAAAAAGGPGAGGAADIGDLRNQVAVTFSAAAAVALGGGGSPTQRIIRTLEEIRAINRQQFEEQKEMRRKLAEGGAVA
ncbi:MAG TPA: hypothetical protein VFW87_21970, partial [Pirellulales bacterium]|nr:hypothetical protein [Pirellulales bacterium]